MTDRKGQRAQTISATLERPMPLLGLKAQNLGSVERIHLSPATRQILSVELRTKWQTLSLPGDAVTFDDRRGAFRLISHPRAGASSKTSEAASGDLLQGESSGADS